MTHHDIPERWQRIAWAIGAHDLATDVDENDLDFTAWAEATHGHTARLALVIAQAIGDTAPVHNHGPAEGRGLNCPESVVNGRLRGACIGRVDEPEQWPTAPLIVADWIATGTAKGHGLAYLDGHEYVTVESGHVLRCGRDSLTNVVPVRVVPAAEWRTVRDAAYIRGSGEGDRDYWARVGRQAVYAVTATDALGLDQ